MTPAAKPDYAALLRDEAVKRGGDWMREHVELLERIAKLKWDHTMAIFLYVDAFEAGAAWQREQYERQRRELRAVLGRYNTWTTDEIGRKTRVLHQAEAIAEFERIMQFDTPAKGER